VVTDFRRLLVVNEEQLVLEEEIVINYGNIDCQQSDSHIIITVRAVNVKDESVVQIRFKSSQQFFDRFQEAFRQSGCEMCANCKRFSLVDDVCVYCGFQLPFKQQQLRQLDVQQKYFPKRTEDVLKCFETGLEQCQISIYLQRKNRFYITRDQFRFIFANAQQSDLLQKSLAHQKQPFRPNLIQLSHQQQLLRQLLAKLYWFSKRWVVLEGEEPLVLPRVNALFVEGQKFGEETLNFIERLYDGCIGRKFQSYQYLDWEGWGTQKEKV